MCDNKKKKLTGLVNDSPQRKALLHVFLKDMDLKPTKDTTTATTLNYYATQISMVHSNLSPHHKKKN